MGKLKDKTLKTDKSNAKTFTLNKNQLNALLTYRQIAQTYLDRILQDISVVTLHNIASNDFGYAPDSKLEFNLDIEKTQDNLIITEIVEK
jgi:hypothetical protein